MASKVLTRGAGALQRCVFSVVLAIVFIGLVHYLDALPTKNVFTSTRAHVINRLGSWPGHHVQPTCGPGAFKHLKDLGLTANVTYSRRCIKPVFSDDGVHRDVVANVSSPLVTNTITIRPGDPEPCTPELDRLPCDVVRLPVPRPGPRNQGQYGHLIFGVATTFKRLHDSLPTFAHWLEDSGAMLVGLIVDDPGNHPVGLNFSSLEADYAAAGVDLKLVPKHDPAHTTEQSHLLVIEDMLVHADRAGRQQRLQGQMRKQKENQKQPQQEQPTHWLGILDDDTFFPSLHELSATLAQYDHTQPQYLGQLTENAVLLSLGVLGAFGGAGIFLSAALARDLRPHLPSCRGDVGGDMQIMDCVHRHSAARLTRVPGLWQCDIVGDPAGFYESGRRMLSMHHWKSWNHLPARDMAAVTRVCGSCFLQRFAFGAGEGGAGGEGTAVLNNGYSINLYGAGVPLPDLSRTEQTWDDWDRDPWKDYQWSLGPLRDRVAKDDKKSYYLATAVPGEKGELTQVYLHRGRDEGKNDEVIELVWRPS